jgi:glycosyltransferase involved in cell wall biosynthesis
MSIAILMPVHNEGERLVRALSSIRSQAGGFGKVTVFLVDDGSEPAVSIETLPSRSAMFEVVLARHVVNLGQGAALETARQLALLRPNFDAYITMDSDGQHGASSTLALAQAIIDGADVALGNRFKGGSQVPPHRRMLLQAACFLEWALTGIRLSDAHNGLRGFSRRALAGICIRQNRMAHATEIRMSISKVPHWRVVEVPVSIQYSSECLVKGQRATSALTIMQDLLSQYLFGDSR